MSNHRIFKVVYDEYEGYDEDELPVGLLNGETAAEMISLEVEETDDQKLMCRRSSVWRRFRIEQMMNEEPRRKYFMYSPSGGFNNQRAEVEYGLLISRLLNRTLIVPMAGKHSTWWTRYDRLDKASLLPFDYILDFSQLDASFDYLTTDLTISELKMKLMSMASESTEKDEIFLYNYHLKYRKYWEGEENIVKHLGSFSARILHLEGPTIYHKWFDDRTVRDAVTRQMMFQRCFLQVAIEIGNRISRGSTNQRYRGYYAMHLRLGDYASRGRVPDLKMLIDEMKAEKYDFSMPLYIATEPTDDRSFFEPLEKVFSEVYYAADFSSELDDLFTQGTFQAATGMTNDLIGIVEQLICILAKDFKGTRYSNFSNYISILRDALLAGAFPQVKALQTSLNALKTTELDLP